MPRPRWPSSASSRRSAAKAIWDEGRGGQVRRRAHRRDRARDQARRHRLPDPPRRARRPRGALRAPGHDLVRRARHLPRRAARARRRPADRRYRPAARGAQDARLRAQDDADHRPQPRHPRRADDVRPQAGQAYAEFARAREAAGRTPATRSRPAPSPARSAPSPTSIRASRSMSPRSWASRSSRSRRRSSRATATPCSSRRSASIASSIERLAIEIRHLQRTEVLRGGGVLLARARRARRPCRTSAIRC